MTTDQGAHRTDGETLGPEQEPTDAGAQDTTQRRQAEERDADPARDPSQPQNVEFGLSPDAAYRQREGQTDAQTASRDAPDGTTLTPREERTRRS